MNAPFDRLSISAHALLKAQEYARLVADRFGPVECAGFLLSRRDSHVVEEVTLAPGQEVDGHSVTVAAASVLAAGREVDASGLLVRGWWHSHGAHPVFHSSIDNETTEDVLGQVAAACGISEEEELAPSLDADGGMVFEREDETLRVVLPASSGGPVRVRLVRRIHVGYAFSLVVNARCDAPRAEAFIHRPGGDGAIVRRVIPIAITSGVDYAQMTREVEDRVSLTRSRATEARNGRSTEAAERHGPLSRAVAWLRNENASTAEDGGGA